MGKIAITVTDAADTWAFDLLVPDYMTASSLATRIAELTRLPLVGPDDYPLNYALVAKHGKAINPSATLSELYFPDDIHLRLVPEITAGADDANIVSDNTELLNEIELDSETQDNSNINDEIEIEIIEERCLIEPVVDSNRPDVRIDANVHRQIEEFAFLDRNTECAGLLLGKVTFEGPIRVIHITAAILAEDAIGTRTSVKFTREAWEEMLHVKDSEYSSLRVVGWFHTHAGWGLFMSDSDIFIHRHYFRHSDMVAYVLDPSTGRDGFFCWKDGRIGLCPSFGLVGSPEEVGFPTKIRKRDLLNNIKIKIAAIGFLCLAITFLIINKMVPIESTIRKNLHLERTNSNYNQTQPLNKTNKGIDKIYILRPGDNLWKICRDEYGDGNLASVLADYNNVNPKSLRSGKNIKLPPKEVLKSKK